MLLSWKGFVKLLANGSKAPIVLQHFLGHFKSEEEGARAYDRALLTRKKKDGCLNFPLSDYSEFADQHQHSLYPSKTSSHVMHSPNTSSETILLFYRDGLDTCSLIMQSFSCLMSEEVKHRGSISHSKARA